MLLLLYHIILFLATNPTLPTACGDTIHRLITFIGCREAAWHMVQAGKGSVWNVIAMGTAITIVARTSLVLRLVASSFSSPLADTLSLWFVPT
jgi:hypothetical protein